MALSWISEQLPSPGPQRPQRPEGEGAVRNLRAAERETQPLPQAQRGLFLSKRIQRSAGGRASLCRFWTLRRHTLLPPGHRSKPSVSPAGTAGLVVSPGHGGGPGTRTETLTDRCDAYFSVRSGGFVCCGQWCQEADVCRPLSPVVLESAQNLGCIYVVHVQNTSR